MFLQAGPHALAHFEREIDILQKIESPQVVKFIHSGLHKKRPTIITAWVHGTALSDIPPCSSPQILKIGTSILRALESIHPNTERILKLKQKAELTADEFYQLQKEKDGYIHRDIKPENIIWDTTSSQAILIDFNISSRTGAELKTRSMTSGYSPPDYFITNNQWTEDADIFAAASVLYFLFEGRTPYDKGGDEEADPFTPSPMTKAPADIEQILLKAVSPRSKDRYKTAEQLRQALELILSQE